MTALLWSLALAHAADHAHTWPDASSLRIESGAGEVTVVAGKSTSVEVTVRSGDCTVDFASGAARVTIKPSTDGGRCTADVAAVLPTDGALELALGAGDVSLEGLRGSAEVQIGAGDLQVDAGELQADVGAGGIEGTLAGTGRLRVGAGSVALEKLAHPVTVDVGTGSVDLGFAKAPEGTVEVRAGIGSVTVDLPDGTAVDARLPKKARLALADRSDAATRVDVKAAMGSVEVH